MRPSTSKVIERLEILRIKLEDEGWYVRANTVLLAIEEIEGLRKAQTQRTTKDVTP